ncbi:MAG: tetratricopeptide repeat protein [Bacteroidetes bacterium]|nr:tetratricopeptide repeat protein [Bacteroidota bacterium]
MIKTGIKLFFILILAAVLTSCGKHEKELKTEDEYLTAAKTLYDSAVVKKDNNLFNEAINKYKEFIAKFPNSDKVLSVYTQIGGIYFDNLQNYNEAINTYKTVYEKYPDKKEAKQSLFMVAFIYDETLKDKENAKTYYKKFLEKYPQDTDPNDKMSESARRMLEVLESGKSIEELILQNSANEDKKQDTKTEVKTDQKDVKQTTKEVKVPDNKVEEKKEDKKK